MMRGAWNPSVDIFENKDQIVLEAELPGLKPEDVNISIENNVLTIRGEKREERTEGEQGKWHLAERRYGTFTRSFVLPRDVDADNIQARFEDGVLSVSIPKSERARRRRIDVGGSQDAQQVGTGEGSGQNGSS